MPSIETILAVTLAGFALSASPGASMLYVLSCSIGHSRSAGFVSAVGLATGGVFLAIATAFGLALIVTQSPVLYEIVRYCGAAYLVYLGVGMIAAGSEHGHTGHAVSVQPLSLWRVFYQGVIVEMLNPKTVLFFMAFIPQFVDAERGSFVVQMLILGLLVPLTAVPSDIVVALTGGTLAQWVSSNRAVHRGLTWLGGLLLVGLGIRIVLV
jgi:threonine/homoserine/homoserine lactone efflux protein